MIKCPYCGRIIMDITQDGGYKVRSRMIILLEGKAVALCPSCKERVDVPLILGDVEPPLPKPKIIVSKQL